MSTTLPKSTPRSLSLGTASLGAALLGGCGVAFGSFPIEVDGVELGESHVETVSVTSLAEGFRVSAAKGDLRIEVANGPTTLEVEVLEHTPNDGQAVFENGLLTTTTVSGEPSAIGDVTLRTDEPIENLELATGLGDVDVHGIALSGSVVVASGLGDCRISDVGEPASVDVSTGKGDIDLADTACGDVTIESGLGDVGLARIRAANGSVTTGLGDIEVEGSRFTRLDATTGVGDIECRSTEYESGDLESGFGDVSGG